MLRATSDKQSFKLAEGNLRQPGGHTTEYVRRTRRFTPSEEEEEEIPHDTEEQSKTEEDILEEREEFEPGFWSVTGEVIIRHHRSPRSKLFMPDEVSDCPVPVKYIDVMRMTCTNLDTLAEKEIEDLWCDAGPKELSSQWTGKTFLIYLSPNHEMDRHG